MKYTPSRNFLLSTGLLLLSFVIIQGIIVPEKIRLSAQANSFDKKTSVIDDSKGDEDVVYGVLYEEHEDIFDEKGEAKHDRSEERFYIVDSNGRKTYVNDEKASNLEDMLGLPVRYDMTKEEIYQEAPSRGPGLTWSGRRRGKALVFLARFQNSLTDPATPQEFKNRMFGGFFGSFNDAYMDRFFRQMTHGKVKYTGDVFGWYEFPRNGSDINTYGDCYLSDADVQEMANFYNVDLSIYNTVITYANCAEYNNIGGVYTGYYDIFQNGNSFWTTRIKAAHNKFGVTGSNGFLSMPAYVSLAIHEIGHSFNLYHSNVLDCGTGTIGNNCQNVEYGNTFDRMGWPSSKVGIFSFIQQMVAGWINQNNILSITGPGSYYIDDVQRQNGTVGALIYMPGLLDAPVFGLEHRKAKGFNSWLADPLYANVTNGLLIYSNAQPNTPGSFSWWVPPINSATAAPKDMRLIDPNPTTDSIPNDTKYDAITGTFSDPNFGIEITVTGTDVNGIYFDVDYNPTSCGFGAPVDDVFDLGMRYENSGGYYINFTIDQTVVIDTYAATLGGPVADMEVDLVVDPFLDEPPPCPGKEYTIAATDPFSQAVLGGPHTIYVPAQLYNQTMIPIDSIVTYPFGPHVLNFTVTDSATQQQEAYSVNIVLTQ